MYGQCQKISNHMEAKNLSGPSPHSVKPQKQPPRGKRLAATINPHPNLYGSHVWKMEHRIQTHKPQGWYMLETSFLFLPLANSRFLCDNSGGCIFLWETHSNKSLKATICSGENKIEIVKLICKPSFCWRRDGLFALRIVCYAEAFSPLFAVPTPKPPWAAIYCQSNMYRNGYVAELGTSCRPSWWKLEFL